MRWLMLVGYGVALYSLKGGMRNSLVTDALQLPVGIRHLTARQRQLLSPVPEVQR